jgi:hypothetical protein
LLSPSRGIDRVRGTASTPRSPTVGPAQGKKVRGAKATAKRAGTVTLTIRPKVKANKLLKRRHHLKVRIKVSFTPTGGSTSSRGKSLTLIRKR